MFIPPCIPTAKKAPPSGPNWIHEVKFDGFRVQIHSRPAGPLRCSETFDDPLLLLENAEARLEGVVSKRLDVPYRSGRRPEWVKVKASWWREANKQRYEKMRGEA